MLLLMLFKKLLLTLRVITYSYRYIIHFVVCVGGDSCCVDGICGENQGDCDADSDCQAGFVCGADNCVGDTFDATDDCCIFDRKIHNRHYAFSIFLGEYPQIHA